MDSPHHAVRRVLHRWQPGGFPPAEGGEPDPRVAAVRHVVENWMDADVLIAHLAALERRTPGFRASDGPALRAVADELIAAASGG